MMETKRLYRSRTDAVISGICGGLGEYLHVDSSIIRLVWLIVTIFTGIFPGILIYLIAIAIIPNPAKKVHETKTSDEK